MSNYFLHFFKLFCPVSQQKMRAEKNFPELSGKISPGATT